MGLSALLRHGAGVGLILADAAFHGLAAGLSSTAGVAVVFSGALTLLHGASLASRLSEWWFAAAFDGEQRRDDPVVAT
jgi:hypothetical protein